MPRYLFFIFLLLTIESIGQPIPYKDIIFDKIEVQHNLEYSNQATIKKQLLLFDLYQPDNDTSNYKRPLIIWMHGGGFKYGSKNTKEIKNWSTEFARRGYAVAAINYSLSKEHPIRKFKDLVSACYNAINDVTLAVHYFKTHADQFNIDTGKIILGGNSAGALLALQTAYSNKADFQNVLDSNLKVANTGNYNNLGIAAVINFWGALFNDDWLARARIPIVSVAGAKDKIVTINTKGVAFFGSAAIHKKADQLGIPNAIKIYDRYGHQLYKHFIPFFYGNAVRQRHKEAASYAASFLRTVLFE